MICLDVAVNKERSNLILGNRQFKQLLNSQLMMSVSMKSQVILVLYRWISTFSLIFFRLKKLVYLFSVDKVSLLWILFNLWINNQISYWIIRKSIIWWLYLYTSIIYRQPTCHFLLLQFKTTWCYNHLTYYYNMENMY